MLKQFCLRVGWRSNVTKTATRLMTSQCDKECHYDIIIVGGGMVGASMACALGKSSYMQNSKVLVLEGGLQVQGDVLTNPPATHSNRVCAISPGNMQFLSDINCWERIPRKCPVKRMQVWDACSDAVTDFNRNNMSEPLCWIVENQLLLSSLTQVISDELTDNVSVKYNTRIATCNPPNVNTMEDKRLPIPTTEVELSDGTILTTNLLIGADGANSFIAKCLNMERVKWEYEQSAVVATLKSSEATNNIVAWQRFLPSGPIALLPLDNNTCSLVWSTSHDHAEKLCKLPSQDFVYEVNNAFWQEYPQSNSIETLKELTQNLLDILSPEHSSTSAMQYPPTINSVEGAPLKFPLGLSHSNQYVRSRVAFIGDAVHRIHPLAGQGVNLGFRDVQGLLKAIEEAKYNGRDAGSLSVLLGYESSRQLGNLPIVMAVDVLKRLYSSDFEPLVALRTIGSTIFNKLDPIKRRVIEQAGL